jgi:hypothetical protein
MTNTKQKLLETKYFLERMIENKSDRDVFKYNLSAFLVAFRSVTMIMQNEFTRVSGFADWYKIQQGKMKADSKMKLLNTKRTMTIHQQPVQPHANVKLSITENIHISDSVSMILTRADGTVERYEPESPKPASTIAKTEATTQWHWYFNEIPNIDVVTVCQECITKLEAIVREFEQRFDWSWKGTAPNNG